MKDVTELLQEVKQGNQEASAQLLPVVYEELRKLATAKMSREFPGQTLQGTDLVHEAYLRLVGSAQDEVWDGRGHFFAAAAEAMRRILVEAARRKAAVKRGGDRARELFDEGAVAAPSKPDEVLAVHEALEKLEAANPEAAQSVKLRYFAGFTIKETAEIMGISPRKTNQLWEYARVWLFAEIGGEV